MMEPQPDGAMRLTVRRVLALLSAAAAALSTPAAEAFQVSCAAGARDPAGRFAGRTAVRPSTSHAVRLFAGNGYREDRPGLEGRRGARILVLAALNGGRFSLTAVARLQRWPASGLPGIDGPFGFAPPTSSCAPSFCCIAQDKRGPWFWSPIAMRT
jgi:hypothetical protein